MGGAASRHHPFYLSNMRISLIFFFALIQFYAFTQPMYDAKRDFMWIFGKEQGLNNVDQVYFDFRTDSISFFIRSIPGQELHQTNTSICDTTGNLLFYSNGCVLVDSNYHYIPGADTINKGPEWEYYCPRSGSNVTRGYGAVNGCWILPVAEKKYKVFCVELLNSTAHTSGMRYTTVIQDSITNLLSGYNVDQFLFQADIHGNKRGIVRHANGRDWWMINEGYGKKTYYVSRIDSSDQPLETLIQTFPILKDTGYHGGGQACFSPDGTKYVAIDARAQCQVFDFDRCAGKLSNPRQIPLIYPYDSIGFITGAAISPNSRFLYLMLNTRIKQYDLWATDIAASGIEVAIYDGWVDHWSYPPTFYQSQLGPDGKIYVMNAAARGTFTVIDEPDSLGLACKVIQHKHIVVLNHLIAQPPRFPNFRLGPIAGSLCDTLTVNTKTPVLPYVHFVLRPNPANNYTVIDISVPDYSDAMRLEADVATLEGKIINSYQLPPYAALLRIETNHLANGMYFVTLKSKGIPLKTEKLVILRE
jgi:hypothetical protein